MSGQSAARAESSPTCSAVTSVARRFAQGARGHGCRIMGARWRPQVVARWRGREYRYTRGPESL
jgi:hypothetical protein